MTQSTCYLDKMYIYIYVFKCKLRENYTQLFRLIFQKKFHSFKKTQRCRIGNLVFIAVSLPRAVFISLA